MMELNQEQLDEITANGEVFTKPAEIAIIVGIDPEYFIQELKKEGSAIRMAFMKGKLKAEAKLRKQILAIAFQGSAPAQALAIKLRDEQNMALTKIGFRE